LSVVVDVDVVVAVDLHADVKGLAGQGACYKLQDGGVR
jgi:hypothetical protein